MDFFTEEQEAKEWERGLSEEEMALDELIALAKRGLGTCEEECLSRSICGEGACQCVRSVFPTPKHYNTYTLARIFFLDALAKASFAAVVSDATPTREETNEQ